MRLGADCAEELKLRARERAQCAPRTRHAFTEQEWRIHHPQQTRFGITRARNKVRCVLWARWLRGHVRKQWRGRWGDNSITTVPASLVRQCLVHRGSANANATAALCDGAMQHVATCRFVWGPDKMHRRHAELFDQGPPGHIPRWHAPLSAWSVICPHRMARHPCLLVCAQCVLAHRCPAGQDGRTGPWRSQGTRGRFRRRYHGSARQPQFLPGR